MPLDAARAALVLRERRYDTSQIDPAIRAQFGDQCPLIVIDTNLDATGAHALAEDIFATTKVYQRTFSIPIEDVLYLEDFVTSPPRYVLALHKHPSAGVGKIYTVIEAEMNYFTNRAVLKVRG